MSAIPVIGLVGGIGSGKSVVGEILVELGCVVTNSDRVAHECLEEPSVVTMLVSRWGDRILSPDGSPDRSAISGIVFSDDAERIWLESVLHPMVNHRRRMTFESLDPNTPGFVIDAPLLFEAGIDSECDMIFFVDAPLDQRLERVMTSRGWSEENLTAREARQMSLEVKRARSTHLISNDGSIEDLRSLVVNAFGRIRPLPPRAT